MMVCVQRTSSTYESLFRATHLAINILSTDQLDVVNRFASKAADKFEGLDWTANHYGSPVIARSSSSLARVAASAVTPPWRSSSARTRARMLAAALPCSCW